MMDATGEQGAAGRRIRAVVVGHVTHDRFGDATVAGGGAFYAARTLLALGADVTLVTSVGEDFGVASELTGLSVVSREGPTTTVFHNHYPHHGERVQWVEMPAGAVPAASVAADWHTPDLLFLAPVIGEVDLAAWVGYLRPRLLAIGAQGWVKAPGPVVAGRRHTRLVVHPRWRPDHTTLGAVDVVLLSDEDLTGQGELVEYLLQTVPLVVLTHGRDGCDLVSPSGTCHVGAYPVQEIDPTGAGDTFAAGFLYGLAEGRSAVQSAWLGAAAAAIVIGGLGGARLGEVVRAREIVQLAPFPD